MSWPPPELWRFFFVLAGGVTLTFIALLFHITPLVPWLIIGTFVFSTRLWVLYARSRSD